MSRLAEICSALGVPHTQVHGGLDVTVPTATRGTLALRIALMEKTALMRAFVLRAPDRRHDEVYARLLRKNYAVGPWRFALDEAGDVFAVAEVEHASVSEDTFDRVLGALAALVDEMFDGLARTGFDVPDDVSLVVSPRN